MDLSIVIPAYNEEAYIEQTIDDIVGAVNSTDLEIEILVVDDGSLDETVAIVNRISQANNCVKLIQHEINRGKGAAVRTGALAACGEQIIFTDADGSTPFSEYFKLKAAIEEGYDIAIASRALQTSHVKTTWLRKLPGRVFHFFVSSILIADFKDTQCGFKLFEGKVAKYLFQMQKNEKWSFDLELLFIAKKIGLKIKEVPVVWNIRLGTKVNFLLDPLKMLRDIFIYRIRYRKLSPDSYDKFIKTG